MPLLDSELFDIYRGYLNPGRDWSPATGWTDTSDQQANLLMLYSIVRGLNTKRALECGLQDGTSALVILKALEETDGHLVSIDNQACPTAIELVRRCGYADRWTFHLTDSHMWAPQCRGTFEFVHLDGDHTEVGARQDIVDFSKHLHRDGIMAVHDGFYRTEHDAGTEKAVYEMLLGEEWNVVVLPFNCNLVLCQRRRPVLERMNQDLGKWLNDKHALEDT